MTELQVCMEFMITLHISKTSYHNDDIVLAMGMQVFNNFRQVPISLLIIGPVKMSVHVINIRPLCVLKLRNGLFYVNVQIFTQPWGCNIYCSGPSFPVRDEFNNFDLEVNFQTSSKYVNICYVVASHF